MSMILGLYGFGYPNTLVYMLQNTEYRMGPYLSWYWRTQNFSKVMKRRKLDQTKAACLLVYCLRVGMGLQILVGIALISLWRWNNFAPGLYFGLATLISYPILWAHLIAVPLVFGRWFVILKEHKLIKEAESIFSNHKGIKIAVAGSYGKTSMKELLITVLSEGKKVAATPANKNVSASHAQFASKLAGDEDILIIEYGEGAPGDVSRFSRITHPTHAIITGLAPAHLDRYSTLEAAGKDIFAVADYLRDKNVYVNEESTEVKTFLKSKYHTYSRNGALGWITKNIEVTINGINFDLVKANRNLHLKSELLGKHQVGPLSLAAALALEFGMTDEQVISGIDRTLPFEHRMQPYQLNGAWIIDDTYNGNIEGIRAGTELLKDLPGKRKLYVTPGLVDQGVETVNVHKTMGELIAKANPDIVVLMNNSVTKYIKAGLESSGFKKELIIEKNPLDFYTNLEHFVAAGDLMIMQNDWTDNYV